MIATISTAVTVLKFVKKNWHWIVIGLMVIGFGITISVMAIKISNRDKKIDKLTIEVEKLAATNTLLLKDIEVGNKQFITTTNFSTSETAVSNINDYSLSNDVVDSLNEIFKNYDNDLSNNTLGGK
jgi:bacteriorhodopsin